MALLDCGINGDHDPSLDSADSIDNSRSGLSQKSRVTPGSPAVCRTKRLSAGSSHRHRLQLEFAPIVPLRHARNLLAQELLAHEQAGDPRHPAREEMTHRLLRRPVRRGDWAVVPRDREATSLRVEVDD